MKYINDRVRGFTLFSFYWELPYFDINILRLYQENSLFRFRISFGYGEMEELNLELFFLNIIEIDKQYPEGSDKNINYYIWKKNK
jgi:hypothetical protein